MNNNNSNNKMSTLLTEQLENTSICKKAWASSDEQKTDADIIPKVNILVNQHIKDSSVFKKSDKINYTVSMNDARFNPNLRSIRDSVHGFIKLSNYECRLIDTVFFQRLRNLLQLGTANLVYPSATHTRFEHSIGVSHLAKKMLESIEKNSDQTMINKYLSNIPELQEYYKTTYGDLPHNKLDSMIYILVSVAALFHDIGHGAGSHLFDDMVVNAIKDPTKKNHPMEVHEGRSCEILRYIIKTDTRRKNDNDNTTLLHEVFDDNLIKFMQNLIEPDKKLHKGFIYEIVSNGRNGIDVDKIDYLIRDRKTLGVQIGGFEHSRLISDATVINNTICYPKQMHSEIVALFTTRYLMHKRVYGHKTVVAITNMFAQIMVLLNPILKISKSIYDIKKFCRLTDNYVMEKVQSLFEEQDEHDYTSDQKQRITQAYELWERIQTRDLYKLIGPPITSANKINVATLGLFKRFPKDELIVHQTKMGYVSGDKNPMEDVRFYDTKDRTTCFKIDRSRVTQMLPVKHREHVCMIYLKDASDSKKMKDAQVAYKETFVNL